jgi:hypothetical protein
MMAQQPPDALIVLQDALTLQHKSEIIDFNMQKRLPGMFVAKEWVEAGGLMSYGESLTDMYRRTAYFVDKILKGAEPADLYLWSKSRRSDFFLPRVGSLPMGSLSPICSGRRRATILKGERPGDLPVRQPTIVRAGDQPEDRKGPRAASSFVSSLAADRRPHSDSAAASPLGVIESQPLVWPNLASSSHPCALAYLIAGRISPSFNPVSAGAATVCHRIVPPSTGAGRPWVYWLQKLALGESSHDPASICAAQRHYKLISPRWTDHYGLTYLTKVSDFEIRIGKYVPFAPGENHRQN